MAKNPQSEKLDTTKFIPKKIYESCTNLTDI